MRQIFTGIVGLVTLAAALALPGGAAQAQSGDTIKIGMAVSSTGTFALPAQSGARGAEIWVDDVNRRGGIELTARNTRSS